MRITYRPDVVHIKIKCVTEECLDKPYGARFIFYSNNYILIIIMKKKNNQQKEQWEGTKVILQLRNSSQIISKVCPINMIRNISYIIP